MSNNRLLIVEDSENLGLMYKQELEDDGYNVDVINSLSKAMILLNQRHYDLVIVEIALLKKERYDPLTILERVRGKVPVVINTTDQLLKNNSYFKAYPYNEKSSDINMLKKKIKYLLKNNTKANLLIN